MDRLAAVPPKAVPGRELPPLAADITPEAFQLLRLLRYVGEASVPVLPDAVEGLAHLVRDLRSVGDQKVLQRSVGLPSVPMVTMARAREPTRGTMQRFLLL